MSRNPLKLLEGAIFLSDAHYSFKHKELMEVLKALRSQNIQAPQLILMGDIFDLLFGGIPYTVERNREAVDLINTLSDNIEIIYLEGNHDFNLSPIFPGVRVFSIKEQPVACEYKGRSVALAHGDFNGPLGYRLYTAIIRRPSLLRVLSLLDTIGGHFIIKALDKKLARKNDCYKIASFESFVTGHLSQLDLGRYTLFIEGHHHQDHAFVIDGCSYINLPALACGFGYMRLGADGPQRLNFKKEEA